MLSGEGTVASSGIVSFLVQMLARVGPADAFHSVRELLA